MKKIVARLMVLFAAIGTAFAQPTIPVSNISPLTGPALVGRESGTGRAQSLTVGSGLDITAGVITATGGGGGAPSNATYITQIPNATLTNEQALSLLSTGIMYVTTSTGQISSLGPILPGAFGGTGNGFMQFSGPATSLKTFTLPNASATILTTNAVVSVAQGGTGQSVFTNGQVLVGNTTSGGLDKTSLTAGSGVTITPGVGSITIAATGSGGNVTNNATLTSGRVVLGGGTTIVGVLGSATNGQLLIGNTTSGNMQLGSITAGANVTVTPSAGGIQIAATGSGNVSATNTLTAGNLVQGAGTTNVATSNISVLGNDMTVPGNITVGNMTTTNLTISGTITGVIPVENGGTELATLTANNIITGNGTGPVTFIAPGTTGNVVTSNGTAFDSSAPTWFGSALVSGCTTVTANSTGNLTFVAGTNITLATDNTAKSVTITAAGGGGTTEGTSTATGTQNDFAHSDVSLLRMNNATPTTITGLVAGTAGQRLTIASVGAGQVNFAHQSGSSSANNRIINQVTNTISLAAGSGTVTLQYDDTTDRWRVINHMQGDVIQTTYSAGNFSASGSMTWTVEAADQVTYTYGLTGRLLTVYLQIDSTAIGGTPSTALQVVIPGGFTAAWGQYVPCQVIDAGTPAIGMAQVVATGTTIYVYRGPTAPNWSASASDCSIRVSITIAVQ